MAFRRLNRRGFLTFLGSASLTGLGHAHAQKQAPVIAILGSGAANSASSLQQMQLLEAGMRELGLIEGRHYVFEIRWAGSDASRFSALSADLLAYRPSAVVVSTNLAAQTVQKLSGTVPIVGTGLNAPIETGLVASLARPGSNITGVSTMAEDVLIKLVEIMREALPEVRRSP